MKIAAVDGRPIHALLGGVRRSRLPVESDGCVAVPQFYITVGPGGAVYGGAFHWGADGMEITAFLGNSDNAVRTQIWIAVAVYVLIDILRRRLECQFSMADILQVLSVNVFEKTPLNTLFLKIECTSMNTTDRNQLRLCDF